MTYWEKKKKQPTKTNQPTQPNPKTPQTNKTKPNQNTNKPPNLCYFFRNLANFLLPPIPSHLLDIVAVWESAKIILNFQGSGRHMVAS